MGNQWHLDATSYEATVRGEIPDYDRLQEAVANATNGVDARRILDLGSGTGATARAVLARHPSATLVGIDGSEDMLTRARTLLPDARFHVADLEDPLPEGPFDLVVSAFAVHHLAPTAKADLFHRIGHVLTSDGRFVLCDVVTPSQPVAKPVPLEEGIDLPSSLDEQLAWLADAGLHAQVVVAEGDLAVIAADRRPA